MKSSKFYTVLFLMLPLYNSTLWGAAMHHTIDIESSVASTDQENCSLILSPVEKQEEDLAGLTLQIASSSRELEIVEREEQTDDLAKKKITKITLEQDIYNYFLASLVKKDFSELIGCERIPLYTSLLMTAATQIAAIILALSIAPEKDADEHYINPMYGVVPISMINISTQNSCENVTNLMSLSEYSVRRRAYKKAFLALTIGMLQEFILCGTVAAAARLTYMSTSLTDALGVGVGFTLVNELDNKSLEVVFSDVKEKYFQYAISGGTSGTMCNNCSSYIGYFSPAGILTYMGIVFVFVVTYVGNERMDIHDYGPEPSIEIMTFFSIGLSLFYRYGIFFLNRFCSR